MESNALKAGPPTDRPINVKLNNGKVSVVKAGEHQLEVNGGDRVIWRFTSDASEFLVVLRGPNIFKGELQTAGNEVSGTVDGSKLTSTTSVTYDIFKKLEWDGAGGCIKPGGPPNPGTTSQSRTD